MIDLTWGRFARFWAMPQPSAWPSSQLPPADPVQLGEAAKRLLDDPTLSLALERVQQKLFESWRNTAPGEREAREAAYRMWWSCEQFKTELRVMIGNARALERGRAA